MSTPDQLIDALNSYEGALVVFDCHGAYAQDEMVGTLVIGGTRCNVWQLKGRVRVPPIVLLSACDTHSIDGSHASVANGMLMLGAEAVLGTLLPVSADHSASFIHRLLFRIQEFVPIVVKTLNKDLRWIDVVSGLQRMTFVTEVLDLLGTKVSSRLGKLEQARVQFAANAAINTRDSRWFEDCLESVRTCTGLSSAALRESLSTWCQVTETMKYVHLGNPEGIVIMSQSMTEAQDELARRFQAEPGLLAS